jgi:hypothetical protein
MRESYQSRLHSRDQFPFASKLIETQKAQAPIVAPNFEVVVARALPLIEDIDDIRAPRTMPVRRVMATKAGR